MSFLRRIFGWLTNKPWVVIGLLFAGYLTYERRRRAVAEAALRKQKYDAVVKERRSRSRASQKEKLVIIEKMREAEQKMIESERRVEILDEQQESEIQRRVEILGRYR